LQQVVKLLVIHLLVLVCQKQYLPIFLEYSLYALKGTRDLELIVFLEAREDLEDTAFLVVQVELFSSD